MYQSSRLYLTCELYTFPKPTRNSLLTLQSSDSNPEVIEKDMLDSFRVNTLGLLHSIQAFLPLIRKGSVKKVVNISTGMADLDVINGIDVEVAGPYSGSKAAANVVVAKYSAAYKSEGILFLSISPGYAATERNFEAAERK
jgi:NAD(P)-dependent dehydrogenase (short-subunit alcohol dehydrogenase family)